MTFSELLSQYDGIHKKPLPFSLVGGFNGRGSSSIFKCNSCGFERDIFPSNFLKNKPVGCTKCDGTRRYSSKEDWLQRFAEDTGSKFYFEFIGQFKGAKKPALFRCPDCSHQWKTAPSNIKIHGSGCPNCVGGMACETAADWLAQYKNKHRVDCPYEIAKYKGALTPVDFTHAECGYSWSASPSNIMAGRGCPRCSKKERYTAETWQVAYKKIHRDSALVIKIYDTANTEAQFHCGDCNKEFSAIASNIMRRAACPLCTNGGGFRVSKGGNLYYIKKLVNGSYFYKIGITNRNVKERYGAVLGDAEYVEWNIEDGSYLRSLEKSILNNFSKFRVVVDCFGAKNGKTEWFREDVLGVF